MIDTCYFTVRERAAVGRIISAISCTVAMMLILSSRALADYDANKSDDSDFDPSSFIDSSFDKTDYGKTEFGDPQAKIEQSVKKFQTDRENGMRSKGQEKKDRGDDVEAEADEDDDMDKSASGERRAFKKEARLGAIAEIAGDWVPDKLDPESNGGFTIAPFNGSPVPYNLNGHVDIERGAP